MKLGTHILFNEHNTIITVNIVVNNVVHNKQPQAIHLAISETRRCRVTKLGDVIATSNSDHKKHVNNSVNNVVLVKQQ